jgi:hypothetical protein
MNFAQFFRCHKKAIIFGVITFVLLLIMIIRCCACGNSEVVAHKSDAQVDSTLSVRADSVWNSNKEKDFDNAKDGMIKEYDRLIASGELEEAELLRSRFEMRWNRSLQRQKANDRISTEYNQQTAANQTMYYGVFEFQIAPGQKSGWKSVPDPEHSDLSILVEGPEGMFDKHALRYLLDDGRYVDFTGQKEVSIPKMMGPQSIRLENLGKVPVSVRFSIVPLHH